MSHLVDAHVAYIKTISDLNQDKAELLQRIKRLEVAIQERDKEWFQVIESILGFHPVSMTEALRIGIERIKKQKQRIKRLEEAGDAMAEWLEDMRNLGADACLSHAWREAKEAKP